MSDGPMHIVIATYADEELAKKVLFELRMDKRGKLIDFEDAALVTRDEQNKIHVKETADLGTGRGAAFGGTVGLFLGSLAGPAGLILGSAMGAMVGGITAKKLDTGISDERLEELGLALQPGKSIIIIVVNDRWINQVKNRLDEDYAEVITETLRVNIENQNDEVNA